MRRNEAIGKTAADRYRAGKVGLAFGFYHIFLFWVSLALSLEGRVDNVKVFNEFGANLWIHLFLFKKTTLIARINVALINEIEFNMLDSRPVFFFSTASIHGRRNFISSLSLLSRAFDAIRESTGFLENTQKPPTVINGRDHLEMRHSNKCINSDDTKAFSITTQ